MTSLRKIGIAAAALALITTSFAQPAWASSTASATCTATQEVCSETHNFIEQSLVTLKTSFPNVTSSQTMYYSLSKGINGANICTGQMGFNATKTCNVGSYRGQVTFRFYKAQNSVGVIRVTG
jgi:phage-related protein